MQIERKIALGVYSDSGLNSVEMALLQTDGIDLFEKPICMSRPYPSDLKERIYQFILKKDYTNTQEMKELGKALTDFHLACIREFYEANKRAFPEIDVIGYSGHVVYYRPDNKVCIALGNAQWIADQMRMPVISQFIQSDFTSGGQGGPLFASFYGALTADIQKPVGILSLGGITTLTCIGALGELQAFDVGLGTALLDHWIFKHTGAEMDFDGLIASKGKVDHRLLEYLLKDDFYQKQPPKTANKNEFVELYEQVRGCSVSDGAATLTALIAHSISNARRFLTIQPREWIIIGGGVYNPTLVRQIKSVLKEPVRTGEECGFENDTLNAQSYAFLSVRSMMGLPISFPQTTGVFEPVTGGKRYEPQS